MFPDRHLGIVSHLSFTPRGDGGSTELTCVCGQKPSKPPDRTRADDSCVLAGVAARMPYELKSWLHSPPPDDLRQVGQFQIGFVVADRDAIGRHLISEGRIRS